MASIPARVLGQRIRQLRTRRELTQQDLAGGDYSKSYISAIEQGKTRPSLEALQRIASRLDVPAGLLLDSEAPGFVPDDTEAPNRRVRRRKGLKGAAALAGPSGISWIDYKLMQAQLLIHTGSPEEALRLLRPMIPAEEGNEGKGGTQQVPTRLYLYAALAAVRSGDTGDAITYAQKGVQLYKQVGEREGLEQVRNVLGTAFYQAGQPLTALEHHRACREAVRTNAVRDPGFRLQVYSNIAADFIALYDNESALEAYKEALELLQDVYSLERSADVLRQASMLYEDQGSHSLAAEYAYKALSLYNAVGNMHIAARIENQYGDMLIQMGDLDSAEGYVTHSLQQMESIQGTNDSAQALINLARLQMKRGNLDQAAEHIHKAVETSRATAEIAKSVGTQGASSRDIDAQRVLARSLALSGEIAAQRGNTKEVDSAFGEAVQIIESSGGNEVLSDIYQRYAQVLAGRGQHEQASKYFERAYKAVSKKL